MLGRRSRPFFSASHRIGIRGGSAFGLVVAEFVINAIGKVIRQVLPFLAVLIVDLFLFTYIPGIVTVLPNALLH